MTTLTQIICTNLGRYVTLKNKSSVTENKKIGGLTVQQEDLSNKTMNQRKNTTRNRFSSK